MKLTTSPHPPRNLDAPDGAILPKRCDQEVKVFGVFGIISLLKCELASPVPRPRIELTLSRFSMQPTT